MGNIFCEIVSVCQKYSHLPVLNTTTATCPRRSNKPRQCSQIWHDVQTIASEVNSEQAKIAGSARKYWIPRGRVFRAPEDAWDTLPWVTRSASYWEHFHYVSDQNPKEPSHITSALICLLSSEFLHAKFFLSPLPLSYSLPNYKKVNRNI